MNTIRCPNCNEALPEFANYCAHCGESMTSPGHTSARFLMQQASKEESISEVVPSVTPDRPISSNQATQVSASDRPTALKGPYFYPLSGSQSGTLLSPSTSRPATVDSSRRPRTRSTSSLSPSSSARSLQQLGKLPPSRDFFDDESKDEPARPMTWHKELDAPSPRAEVALPPRPSEPAPILLTPRAAQRGARRRVPPAFFFWMSLVVLSVLLLSGIFGVAITIGKNLFNQSASGANMPMLQASSDSIAIGATLTLRGTHFSQRGHVGLTRDATIPIVDTGGATIIQADDKGDFTDTVTVDTDWQAGAHTLNAEDAIRHKTARFSLLVTGQSASLRPSHLNLSVGSLDFGSGDPATNSIKTISLTNTGGGQISWQGNSNQPWLMLSPPQGTFVNGEKAQVTIAVERANMKPGPYSAQIVFSSNAGDGKLPVTMQVVPLVPGQDAVLEVTPPLLSFTGTDGGASPPAQNITVSNPGVRPLPWSVSTSTSWLSVSPQSGTVQNASSASTGGVSPSTAAGALLVPVSQQWQQAQVTESIAAQTVRVSVDTSTLLPGTYNGVITFSGQGSEQVKDSPQSIFVSVTVTPQCSLQVSPSLVTFAGVYQQSAPSAKIISVSTSQGCNAPIQWGATSTANWLVLAASSGTTPTYPSVSVNSAGLSPGSYTGSIIFTTSTGTQTIPVNFTLGQANSPLMNVSAAVLAYNGVVGQSSPASQSVTVSNTAGGTLSWQASVATSVGGSWLAVAPASGNLTSKQSASLTVTATLLNSLVPGTYNGTITFIGTDGAGHTVPGSPQVIPVSFVVQAPCTIATSPSALSFTGAVGQAAPNRQPISITASGACARALNWTATVPANGNWLVSAPAAGTATLMAAGISNVGISLAGLAAGNYQTTLTIAATDSVTHAVVGSATVTVSLAVQPACTLQAPSAATENFTTEGGLNPKAQSFSVSVAGACAGNVAITPKVTLGSGTGWLAVTPNTATVLTGGNATFTVTVTSSALAAGSYGGSIALSATNSGVAIAGSPQTVGVTLAVTAPPTLSASPGSLSVNVTNGSASQPIAIANTGGAPLNWTAALASGSPSFVSLSNGSGTLAGGANTTTSVVANASGVSSGTYTANVTITAIDPKTGKPTGGSPTTVQVTINVSAPSMQLSKTNLSYSAPAGTNPQAQSITVTNSGGGTLSWTAGAPSAAWLSVSPTSDSDASGAGSTVTFAANAAGLAAGTYTATVVITPSAGRAVTVNVTLTVTAVAPTPTPSPAVGGNLGTPTPAPTTAITPTSTAGMTPTSSATP